MTDSHGAQVDCPSCGRPAAPDLTTGEVTHGSVSLLAEGLPVHRCPAGHRWAPDEVVAAGLDACAAAVARARRRRLRGETCRSCRAALTIPGRRTTRTVSVATSELAVHTLHFDLPMVRCPECGLEQLPAAAAEDADESVRALGRPVSPTSD